MMAEESRGKRRKQANPKRNQVSIERVASLGSEEEDGDELGLWSLEPQDYQGSLDKTSLTPSEGEGDREGTEPGGTPSPSSHFPRPHSLSPREKNWAEGLEEEGPESRLMMQDQDGGRRAASIMTYIGQGSDNQALEDMAHYDFLVQLRKASSHHPLSHYYPRHHPLPDSSRTPPATYLPTSLNLHDDNPSIWSPAAQRSPCVPDGVSLSPDAIRNLQACPFCQRTYHHGASLREHIKFCHEHEGGHMVCTASYREQMEQQMALHSQVHDKLHSGSEHGMESRKFKCLQCGKAFKYKHHLKEHLRIHSGEKPYECSNCKKRFSHSGSYSSHLSSKKCLTGGGGSAEGASYSNGLGHHGVYHSSTLSPSTGSGRNVRVKGSPYPPHTKEGSLHVRLEREPNPQGHQDMGLLRGQELGREFGQLWDPTLELSLQESVFKGTTLMPYLHSSAGGKFEQMLQEMLRREKGGPGLIREDGRPGLHNGGRDGMAEGRLKLKYHQTGSGEGHRFGGEGGVACRWCSQIFPSPAVLLQHEHYLCKMNQEAVEVPEGTRSKNHHSPLYLSTRPLLQPPSPAESHIAQTLINGFPKDKSPLQKPGWHSVPQQLLVAMHSPLQPRPDSLPRRSYWSSQESGGSGSSPGQPALTSPATEMSSPPALGRRRVHSSGFGSPLCLDLSSTALTPPPSQASSQIWTPRLISSQTDQPLDLSLPKPQEGNARENSKPSNGYHHLEEKIQGDAAKNQHHRRLSLSPPSHQHPAIYRGAPMFGRSIYSAHPLFNSSGLSGSRHDRGPSLPISLPTSNHGFISPITYMMESDTESVLKRFRMERQALMNEMMGHGSLDYISLIEEGGDGDGGPGRKRLKKTDEGLYACDICEKTFQKSSSLLRHKYEHTGKRPHECKTCKKAFKHKHHLIEHSRLHSGEKPYQCDKCGKRFSHSGSYSQHMNHRYAYCSRDQDHEAGEELPLTPGGSTDLGHRSGGTPLSMEENHIFLSDSSLDGGIGGRLDEEEEEDEMKGGNVKESCSLSGSGEGFVQNHHLVPGSPAGMDRKYKAEDMVTELVDGLKQEEESAGQGTLKHNMNWGRDTLEANGDQNKNLYEISPAALVSQ
ncbi:hypothetical protein UPYG_G00177340 [Umbra pygmaea]|uniref:C2H2-type domain-containing protein n=1 Tax=Umbra pygmaea TaxID=75934 RepID=A0ABD0WUI0_UMBPY